MKDSVKIVVVDDNQANAANLITATTGYSTEQQQQQHHHHVTIHHNNNNNNNNNNKNSGKISSSCHRTCPSHAHEYLPNVINTTSHEPLRTLLFAANSKDAIGGGIGDSNDDASTNSSAELLEIEAHIDEDKISPIFEEDIDNDDDNDNDNDDEHQEEGEGEEEEEQGEESSEIDVEKEDSEFCGNSRKSTFSIKSSASRYDKLLTLNTPKQSAVASGITLTTSKSFNESSNSTANKLQKLRKKSSIKNQQEKQQQQQQQQQQLKQRRWHGKCKIDGKKLHKNTSGDDVSSGSEKNIVQRVLLSLAPGGGKSTSSLKFGPNKLNFLHVSRKTKSNKTKFKKKTQDDLVVAGEGSVEIAASTSAAATTTITTDQASNANTQKNLNKIITSLLRTTTI